MNEQWRHSAPQERGRQGLDQDTLSAILKGDEEAIVKKAESLAQELKKLPPTQLRNFYTPLVQLRESQDDLSVKLHKLVLHRPRLAYMRARKGESRPLQRDFDWLIREVAKQKDPKQLDYLFEFAEAVVAYHKTQS